MRIQWKWQICPLIQQLRFNIYCVHESILRERKDKPINWFVNTVVEVLCITEATWTLVVITRMLILWLTDSEDEEDKTIAGSKSIYFFYATDI